MAAVAGGRRTMTTNPSLWWRSWARRPEEQAAEDADAAAEDEPEAVVTMPADPAAGGDDATDETPTCPACGGALLSVGGEAFCPDWSCSASPLARAALAAEVAAARHRALPAGYRYPEQHPSLAVRQVAPIKRVAR